MNIKKRFSRCATVLAVAMTLGQTMIAPTQVLANGLDTSSTEQVTEESTTQATIDSSQAEGLETTNDSETTESSEVSLPETITGDKQEDWTIPYTQTDASGASAFTTDGNQIIFNQNFGMMTRGTGNSSGQLTQTYGAYSVSTPYITMTGEYGGVVWCINPDKGFPVDIEYAQQVYKELGVYNILYYAEANGWNQANSNYVDVYVALNVYLGHPIGGINMNVPSVVNSPNVAFLLNKAQVKDAPTGNFDIKNKVQTADFDVASKLQVTDWYTPETTGSNVTYQIPTDLLPDGVGVELSNGTKYQAKTGSKTVNANVKFRLTAPASYTGKVKFDVDTNFKKKSALIFRPTTENTQDLVKAGWLKDPVKVTGIEGTFFARLGNAKFKKISEISNLPLEGVTYKVTEEGKEPYEMKTDANGELNFVDRFHGATIKVQEIANPIGYILDSTEYELTIEAAETVSKTLVNNVPRGKAKLNLKQQTVLDIEATKEKGEPVYKKVPLAGAKFNVVAVTNIMLPDGKTVLTKAGEVVDTITTDSKGYAETTKELFVGKANVYRLVEVNVPEGYREPSEDQTLFTIPSGNNTEKLIVYDLGTIDNELQTGKLNFLKRDSLAFTGIEGATFTVEMMSGLYKGTYFNFQTKAEGNEFKLPVGDYKITEIKLPSGFTFDESTPQTQWVTIKDNETIELNWNNKKLVPEVGISTQAHTGDGTSQTFKWGEGATFYDDSNLTHKDIPVGTKRAYETKLHAIYADGTQAVVWESGLVDYTVTDKEMTKRVIAEYDYRKDPKADEKTRWYFSEDGYNYDNEKPKKDTEHNPKGKDPKQQLTPVKKPVTPTTPTKPTTPQKAVGTFPQTGEKDSVASLLDGLMAIVAVIAFYVIKKRKETTVE